jgi:hypothetical protein
VMLMSSQACKVPPRTTLSAPRCLCVIITLLRF